MSDIHRWVVQSDGLDAATVTYIITQAGGKVVADGAEGMIFDATEEQRIEIWEDLLEVDERGFSMWEEGDE